MMEIKVVLVELLKKYRVTRGPETQVRRCAHTRVQRGKRFQVLYNYKCFHLNE